MKSSKVLVNIDGYIAHPMIQTYGQYSIKYIFGGLGGKMFKLRG